MTAGHDSPERDPALERAWRARSRETPPPELDRAILAAAHRAAGSAPHNLTKSPAEATRPQRWWMPLAAAATIGVVAIGILQVTPDEEIAVAPTKSAVPAVAPRAEQRVASAAPETSSAADAVKELAGGRIIQGTGDAKEERLRESVIGNGKNSAPAPEPAPSSGARLPSVARTPSAANAPFPVAKRAPESADAEAKQKLAMAPAPQPFPAAPGQTQSDATGMAERKLEAGRASGSVAGAAKPNTPTEVMRDNAAAGGSPSARKDAAGEDKQQLAAAAAPAAETTATPPLATASAGAATSSAIRPAQSAPARAREFDQARAEPRQQPMAAAPATAPPPASLAKTAIAQDDLRVKARDPAAWIARIRQLRDEGNAAEAIRELRELRRAVPDADQRLPADMREWAASVKP